MSSGSVRDSGTIKIYNTPDHAKTVWGIFIFEKGENNMDLVEYTKSELSRLEKNDKDGEQKAINKSILEIIEVFNKQGFSGFSAGYTTWVLDRLLRFRPLSPLTGEDNEWDPPRQQHANGVTVYQNKRCPSVFKAVDLDDNTVRYHDVDADIVSDNGGITWFTSRRFRKEIKFPYMPPVEPEKVYIEYKEDVPPGFTGDEYDIITDNPERIKALYERKRKEFDEEQKLKGIIRKSSAKPWGEGE